MKKKCKKLNKKVKKRKRGRPKGIKRLDPKEFKRMRRGWNKSVRLDCSKCGGSLLVHTDSINLPLYTKELRKNWVCLYCRNKKKKGMI